MTSVLFNEPIPFTHVARIAAVVGQQAAEDALKAVVRLAPDAQVFEYIDPDRGVYTLYNIDEAQRITNGRQTVNAPALHYWREGILTQRFEVDADHVLKVDTNEPIILAPYLDQDTLVVDGWHRIAKRVVEEGGTSIDAVVLAEDEVRAAIIYQSPIPVGSGCVDMTDPAFIDFVGRVKREDILKVMSQAFEAEGKGGEVYRRFAPDELTFAAYDVTIAKALAEDAQVEDRDAREFARRAGFGRPVFASAVFAEAEAEDAPAILTTVTGGRVLLISGYWRLMVDAYFGRLTPFVTIPSTAVLLGEVIATPKVGQL